MGVLVGMWVRAVAAECWLLNAECWLPDLKGCISLPLACNCRLRAAPPQKAFKCLACLPCLLLRFSLRFRCTEVLSVWGGR